MDGWKSINGWLTSQEGDALQSLARGRCVLEIGSLFGRSTVCLAAVAEHVLAVDPHCGAALRNMHKGEDTLPQFRANLERHQVAAKVTVLRSPIEQVAPWLIRQFGLVFVDGDHSEAACWRDLQLADKLLVSGGVLAVHDYGYDDGHLAGVKSAVDRFANAHGCKLRQVKTLAILERKP